MYIHFDGYPDSKLPLLLAAYQHRFAGDVEAMARHLIDEVHHGWEELGTDLLDGAPATLRRSLTGGEEYPSRQLTNVYNTDGTPAERELITQDGTEDLEWAYVLHESGIEVIGLLAYDPDPSSGGAPTRAAASSPIPARGTRILRRRSCRRVPPRACPPLLPHRRRRPARAPADSPGSPHRPYRSPPGEAPVAAPSP